MPKLVQHKNTLLTPDTIEALNRAGSQLVENYGDRFSLSYRGCPTSIKDWGDVERAPGPTKMSPFASMLQTGREVCIELKSSREDRGEALLSVLWSVLVPNGFVPWDRYPLPSPTSHVFHYFGDWINVGDSLQGEGRGEHSWYLMCVASQLEVDKWEGGRVTERSIQAGLHKLGIPCGPIDGIVGDRTIGALKALGILGQTFEESLKSLNQLQTTPKKKSNRRRFGRLFIEESNMRVFTSGSVTSQKTRNGYVLTSWGPGVLNVIVD